LREKASGWSESIANLKILPGIHTPEAKVPPQLQVNNKVQFLTQCSFHK
jgi:hypothetical protein